MAFKIHKIDDGRIPGIEYLPCGAITPKVGMALVQSAGNLAIATRGTHTPNETCSLTDVAQCAALLRELVSRA